MSADAPNARPAMLDGVRVIECSLLGPAAITSHLIDLGAEVIKVESPAGDYGRKMTWPLMDGTSLLHLHVNRGKQSLVLNLKQPEAIAVFEDLVRESDVVIEAMRPGFLAKMGLGYDHLRELNPKIVMCTISGYGATGPYQNLPSHGIAYDAWSGTIQPVVDDEGFCPRRRPARARAWRSRSPTARRTSTGTASRRGRATTTTRTTSSPGTRATTTSGAHPASPVCGKGCATSTTSRPTGTSCSWHR